MKFILQSVCRPFAFPRPSMSLHRWSSSSISSRISWRAAIFHYISNVFIPYVTNVSSPRSSANQYTVVWRNSVGADSQTTWSGSSLASCFCIIKLIYRHGQAASSSFTIRGSFSRIHFWLFEKVVSNGVQRHSSPRKSRFLESPEPYNHHWELRARGHAKF
jgi:hypothetical protein